MTTKPAAPVRPAKTGGVRAAAAQATRESILKAATKIFAKHGYDGGSIERISTAARSYDRMIYYYYGSKEGLFVAVLESMYRRFNEAEARLKLDGLAPPEAMNAIIRFICGYYRKNPEFITLLNTENLHRGRHIAKSPSAHEHSSPAVGVIATVLASGSKAGHFRRDVAARDVYLMVASMGYFYLSNRFTLSAFLGEDLESPAAMAHWEDFIIRAVHKTLAA